MSELTIREMGQDEDFSAWFSELLEQEEGLGGSGALDDHYLILSNEIGDFLKGSKDAKKTLDDINAAYEASAKEGGFLN